MSGAEKTARSVWGVLAFFVLGIWSVASCDGGTEADARRAELAASCALDSQCTAPLVCALKRCHGQCQATRDCPPSYRCVPADKPHFVCELDGDKRTCAHSSDCPAPHVCGVDGQCRGECLADVDCAVGQHCSFGTCADPDELSGGELPIRNAVAAEGRRCDVRSDCPQPLVCGADGACHSECRLDVDCPGGVPCLEGVCRSGSASGDGGVVAPGTPCVRSSECGTTLVCLSGRCEVECKTSRDCAQGRVCETVTSRCVLSLDGGPATDGGDAGCLNCGPSCTDFVKNGEESDVDCGGGRCAPCPAQAQCRRYADCASSICTAGRCARGGCNDGVKNGDETDADCGGAVCSACAAQRACRADTDCSTRVCSGGTCREPLCADGVRNGGETDVDCGGPVCGPCADTRGCTSASDCLSARCAGGTCQPSNCTDAVKNGRETDVDCGGPCARCGNGAACIAGSDCLSGVCVGSVCLSPRCNDGFKNGMESDADCGGPACVACSVGQSCFTHGDCASKRCKNGTCVATATVTVARQGTAPGRVRSDDLDCGTNCSAQYETGAIVTLLATPVPSASFTSWGGPCTGQGACSFLVAQDTTVTATFDAPPEYVPAFVRTFPPPHGVVVGAVELTGDGYVAGQARNGAILDMGFGPVFPPSSARAFLARYDTAASSAGAVVWGRLLPEIGNVELRDMTGSLDGLPWTIGRRGGDPWVGRFDAVNGNPLVFTFLPARGGYGIDAIAVGSLPGGDSVAAARFAFYCGTECDDPNYLDIMRVSGTTGGIGWRINGYCGEGFASVSKIVTDAVGGIFVGGTADARNCNFGGGNRYLGSGFWVHKMNANGGYLWDRLMGGSGGAALLGMATDANGDLYLAGRFAGQITLAGYLPALTSQGGQDGFLVKLSGATGIPLWAKSFGTPANESFNDVTVMGDSNEVIVLGTYSGATTFEGVTLPNRASNWFLARLSGTSAVLSVQQPGNGTVATPTRVVARGEHRRLLLTGQAAAAGTFGTFSVPAGHAYAAFFQVN